MQSYCPEFKRECVREVLSNNDISIDAHAAQFKVGRATLFRWLKLYSGEALGLVKRTIRPQTWSMSSKLKIILEADGMNEQQLGAYLRKKGLYYSHISQWKAEVLDEVKKRKGKTPTNEAALLRRVRELERELKIKDKALKEATALVILKKKAELLWGDSEEESSKETPEQKPLPSLKKRKKTEPE